MARPAGASLMVLALLLCGCGHGATLGPDAGGVDAGLDGLLGDARAEAGAPYCAPVQPDGGFGQDGACPVKLPSRKDLLDKALARLKLDRCKVVFSEADKKIFPSPTYERIWKDPYRLWWVNPVHDAALNMPPFARWVVSRLDAAASGPRPVTAALSVALHLLGYGGKVCLSPTRDASSPDPLAAALARLIVGAGGKATAKELAHKTASVPANMRAALAPVVDAIAATARARDQALKGADLGPGKGVTLQTLFEVAASMTITPKSGKGLGNVVYTKGKSWAETFLQGKAKGLQYGVLYRAAVRLAATVEGARLTRFAGVTASLNVDTPLGRVIIAGPGNDAHDPADPRVGSALALLLDTGGDDTYLVPAGATASAKNPVSVAVDLGGNDSYGYAVKADPNDTAGRLPSDADARRQGTTGSIMGPVSLSMTSRQGAGRLGVGLLFDLGAGKDTYKSPRMSQGFGALGVGVLYDDGGDDTYVGEDGVQGAGVFGVGLLLDGGGNDTYKTYHQSQGFGYVMGVGVLHDRSGDDQYLADLGDPKQGGDPLYYTPQLPGKGNSSFCQGAGFGRRDDTYGKFMSGGIGVLRDVAGNDRYLASVFGQGTGYWFGTGILADGGGNDVYNGLWYVQGADAHFAMAMLWDAAGNDQYNPGVTPRATSIGVGHDFSVGWHLDLGGDDTYNAPGLSLGSGNDNGIGLLVNLGGTDRYTTRGKRTLGGASIGATAAGNARKSVINLGVFVDTGGSDTYVVDGKTDDRNNKSWLYVSTNKSTTKEWGVGLDGSGTVTLP